jgi:succinate dehydrogenase hydrophobic anchor subunit
LGSALALGASRQLDFTTLMRWTFVPNPNHVINSGIPDVTLGWANAFWQIMQILIVALGFTHGFNGLRSIIDDFMCKSIWCPLVRGVLILSWLFVLIVATYVILAS